MTIHVPAAPGDHIPDDDTRLAMRMLLDAALQARDEAIDAVTEHHRIRADASWSLPDGTTLSRSSVGQAVDRRRLTLRLEDRLGVLLARCIVDGHLLMPASGPDFVGDCVDVSERALKAVSSIPPGSRDALVDLVDSASREHLRQVAVTCGIGDLVSRGFAADHVPAWPWDTERISIDSSRFSSKVDPRGGVDPFPEVIGVAVGPPEDRSRRICVRLSAYHMDHDAADMACDPVARLRDAAALHAAREGSGS